MALPCCPECGAPALPVYDRANDVRALKPGLVQLQDPPHRFEIEVFRSYACSDPRCGWSGVYIEKLCWNRPSSLRLRGKFCQPADSDPVTGAA